RRFTWRSDHPAQLYWTEAQDGGDPRNEAAYRDQLFYLEPPFTGTPIPSVKIPLRYGAIRWCRGDLALFIDWSWKERRQVTHRWYPDEPERTPEILFDHNWEDQYNDPGNFAVVTQRNDHTILLTRDEGKTLVLMGEGHSPNGTLPFIDLYDLESKTTTRKWQSTPPHFERPLFFLDEYPDLFLLAREQLTERPNYYLRNFVTGTEILLTDFEHPYPQLRDAQYEKIRYKRADGVQLSGDLHTPKGFTPSEDSPLPVLMWAYPQEFKDADKAGQVTTSPHQFTRISPLAPLPFLAAGFAVFDDFAMPIVGEGDEEPNETFIEQVRMNAQAAVDQLIELGVADPNRIYVGGHSYGAFMTAHLLAHTDLFAGGIARSGAYNRTLTPFGFQAEERSFWEVPDTYIKLSPFVHADKIDAPLLLIHGEEDSNSGTYPVQSKRLFAALNSLGKTARLCLLPYEDHSYAAEESILHMLWEMERWMGD
ncbi:MAG: prolyl oligopeptidase family serine peptidase, partial [Bacteroidota bacterium]